MVVAGYCAYGSATELVITYGHGIERFTLDPSIGEFILTAENMKLPEKQKTIYSINEGNYTTWDEPMQKAVDDFKKNNPKPYTARYVGSMVADVHRTLMYGGIYLYPADAAKVRCAALQCHCRYHIMSNRKYARCGWCFYCRATASFASCTKASPWRRSSPKRVDRPLRAPSEAR